MISTEVASFAEIAPEFLARVASSPWCSAATVDRRGRPRSRIVHPVWEGSTGWIGTRARSHKLKHLAQAPYLSLAYIADVANPVYVECAVRVVDETAEKRWVWEVMAATPPPLGYDPAPIFGHVEDPGFVVLELTPWRVEVATIPRETRVWHRDGGQ
jgi:general stress protein 26